MIELVGGEYGYNAYTNRPPLVRVVALYVLGMVAGAILGCWGAINANHNGRRFGTALIGGGLGLCALSSVVFVLGLGWT